MDVLDHVSVLHSRWVKLFGLQSDASFMPLLLNYSLNLLVEETTGDFFG